MQKICAAAAAAADKKKTEPPKMKKVIRKKQDIQFFKILLNHTISTMTTISLIVENSVQIDNFKANCESDIFPFRYSSSNVLLQLVSKNYYLLIEIR